MMLPDKLRCSRVNAPHLIELESTNDQSNWKIGIQKEQKKKKKEREDVMILPD